MEDLPLNDYFTFLNTMYLLNKMLNKIELVIKVYLTNKLEK